MNKKYHACIELKDYMSSGRCSNNIDFFIATATHEKYIS